MSDNLHSQHQPAAPEAEDNFLEIVNVDEIAQGDNEENFLEIVGTEDVPGQIIDESKGRIFPCEGCGADLKFHIGEQQLKCPYCGYVKELTDSKADAIEEQNFHAMLEQLTRWRTEKQADASLSKKSDTAEHEVRCAACGGNIVFSGSLTSSECPYCASPIQRDRAQVAKQRVPVEGVLPFLLTRKKAHTALRSWVDSRWFAPSRFRKRGIQGTFSGVYLPYWTFDTMTGTYYEGQRGEYYYVTTGVGKNRKRKRRTRWYPASGTFQRFFDDVLVSATLKMKQNLLGSLDPWPLAKLRPYHQEVLAGFLGRTYELELDDGFQTAKQRIDSAIDADVRSRIGGDTQRVEIINSHYDAITYKHILLPVWLLAYRYHDEVYQVLINATTGKVVGERPYSWIKIFLAVMLFFGVVAMMMAVAALMGQS